MTHAMRWADHSCPQKWQLRHAPERRADVELENESGVFSLFVTSFEAAGAQLVLQGHDQEGFSPLVALQVFNHGASPLVMAS